MVYVDREAMQARRLTLMDVVHALNDSNLIIPAGDAKIGPTDYFIYTNSMIEHPGDINNVPVKIGAGQAPVLVGDVGHAEDAAQIQQNIVRINGQRSDVDIAYGKWAQAKADVDVLETMVGYTRIVAPFAGVVTGRFVDPGAPRSQHTEARSPCGGRQDHRVSQ